MKILVTGGAGFIGSALVRELLLNTNHKVINLDALTYSGNLNSIPFAESHENYQFEKCDICDYKAVKEIFLRHEPNLIFHLAAESHVDRSIHSPRQFIQTNILGTYNLLDAALNIWRKRQEKANFFFKFHHISTDEVFGDLGMTSDLFNESTSYDPSSPYSASKASSDHLVRAWGRTYGLPYVITNCSNNYGPYQFPEKLIPNTIIKALSGENIPVYGDGSQIRDWLYVGDHIEALLTVAMKSDNFESYTIGGHNELKNIDVVQTICKILDEVFEIKPNSISSFKNLISNVDDRPGHDLRYAIDATKIKNSLKWQPKETFNSGILKTVKWYIDNKDWWEKIKNNSHY